MIDCGIKSGFERRHLCFILIELRFGLLYVEVAGQPVFVAVAGKVQDILLHADVALHDVQALLIGARTDVVARDFGEQRNQNVTFAIFRGADLGIGRFHGAAGAAKDVQFPRGIEVSVVKVVTQWDVKATQRRKRIRPIEVPRITAAGTDRRPKAAGDDALFRAGFAHARFRDLKCQVGLDGRGDEGVEVGIAEIFPPDREVGGAIGFATGQGCGPLSRRTGFRRPIVWPYGATGKKGQAA